MTTVAVRSVFKPRIGRSLAFNRPWSHSTRLFAYLTVLCNACGNNSSITCANAAARVGHDLVWFAMTCDRHREERGRCGDVPTG